MLLLSGLHHYGSILSSVVGRTHSHYQFPELPTTVVEAWYCYCSADFIIILTTDLQSLSAHSHYSSGGLVLLLLSGLHHYGSILSSVVGRTHSHYQFPELPTTVVEAWYCYCSVDAIIMDLHVFCQLLSVDSQSLSAP